MPRLLIVHHSPTSNLQRILEAVVDGASDPAIEGVEVVVRPALEAGADDVLGADGYLLGTSANFGYMSGALKHFFDTIFLEAGGSLAEDGSAGKGAGGKKPYGLWVHGRYDTTGAVRSVQSIVQALSWTQSADGPRDAGRRRRCRARSGPRARRHLGRAADGLSSRVPWRAGGELLENEGVTMTVPDALPTLSAGSHDAEHGEACVMEYVSLLAGEEWSDRPECTHPMLAHEARTTNDLLRDSDRARLVPLIGRLFGTTEDSPELRAGSASPRRARSWRSWSPTPADASSLPIEEAEAWLDRDGGSTDVQQAIDGAIAYPRHTGDLDPVHTSFHLERVAGVRVRMTPELGAAEAYAAKAHVIAHLMAASGECRADCGNEPARARRMVKDLAGLIDVYDEVTGRAATPRQPGERVESSPRASH